MSSVPRPEPPGALAHRAVAASLAEGTARLMRAQRDSEPVPEPEDSTGEGVVDFDSRRIWMTERMVTTRDARKVLSDFRNRPWSSLRHPLGAASYRLWVRWERKSAGRWRDIYIEEDLRSKRKRNGRWSTPWRLGRVRECEHPFWLLKPLSRLQSEPEEVASGELVRGVPTTRYAVSLTAAEVPAESWELLAEQNAPPARTRRKLARMTPQPIARDAVACFIWLDGQERIRRMSFEADYTEMAEFSDVFSSWAMTEFWDFGVRIDRQAPLSAAEIEKARREADEFDAMQNR